MKKVLKIVLLLSWMGSWTALADDESDPVTTVPELNVDQYLGKWYQIATIPAWFQRNCVKNTTAEYSKREDGLIRVENRCEKEDGKISSVEGAARLNPKFDSPSKLQVSFVKLLGHWIWLFGGNYWVMDLGKSENKYEYSIVGDPTRKYLWILARKPQLSLEELRSIRDKIKAQSYSLDKIIVTQEGELKAKKLSALDEESSQP
ncbi:MAG: lipocalin family protein [Oligoflexales bacterium]|nr:lipocalin family protein [Oligoflexales bacterium]